MVTVVYLLVCHDVDAVVVVPVCMLTLSAKANKKQIFCLLLKHSGFVVLVDKSQQQLQQTW